MRHSDILVLGGSGFIGSHLVAALAARGVRVCVPSRRREKAKHLILLPTVDVVDADVHDPRTLARLARGRDAVVNLVGILHGRRGRADERGPNDYGPDFARVHVELAQAAVNACREAGVGRLVHLSSIGAALDAPSEYLRSKGVGERVVLAAEDLETTVLRPSIVYGPGDRFLNVFARLARWLPVIAVPCPAWRSQPVYVGDVVAALLAALGRSASSRVAPAETGRFDLAGPRAYRFVELVRFACAVTGRRRLVIGMPGPVARLQARMFELVPEPPFTRDNLASMQVDSVSDARFPFGIEPQALEAAAPDYLAGRAPSLRYSMLRWRAHR
jgi:NADH dehydrogenase